MDFWGVWGGTPQLLNLMGQEREPWQDAGQSPTIEEKNLAILFN